MEGGSLYPLLHPMEEAGLIKAEWAATENNRRARLYQITRTGIEAAGTGREKGSLGAVMSLLPRLTSVSRTERLKREIEAEQEFHIAFTQRSFVDGGMLFGVKATDAADRVRDLAIRRRLKNTRLHSSQIA